MFEDFLVPPPADATDVRERLLAYAGRRHAGQAATLERHRQRLMSLPLGPLDRRPDAPLSIMTLAYRTLLLEGANDQVARTLLASDPSKVTVIQPPPAAPSTQSRRRGLLGLLDRSGISRN